MKIKRGEPSVVLPTEIGQILGVVVDEGRRFDPGKLSYVLFEMSPAEMESRHKASAMPLFARPVAFAVMGPQAIKLWPSPAEDAELFVTFFPPQVTL